LKSSASSKKQPGTNCCELAFPDRNLDVMSCRMGFMFFPDMQRAACEMFRVLKQAAEPLPQFGELPTKSLVF